MSAEQATGSLARSSTEFDVFLLVIGEITSELECLLNERLMNPLIDLNYEVVNGKYPRFAFCDLTDAKKTAIFNMWIQAIGAKAVTPRATDEQRLRQLAGFDPLTDDEIDEVDTSLESERTDKTNDSFFKTETQKRVYEHARDKNFVLKLVERSRK